MKALFTEEQRAALVALREASVEESDVQAIARMVDKDQYEEALVYLAEKVLKDHGLTKIAKGLLMVRSGFGIRDSAFMPKAFSRLKNEDIYPKFKASMKARLGAEAAERIWKLL